MKKVIIVTGASSGIGKATALQLIEEGHIVYGLARRVEKMQDLIDAGGHAKALDITDHKQIKEIIQDIKDQQQRVDILVNNAGYAVYGPIEEIGYEQAKRQFEVNLFGLAEITKAVLPTMRIQNSGTVINISSVGGKIYTPLGAWYHATKHALEGWSDCLRLEVKQFGINVVIIEPGAIKTEFDQAMDHQFGTIEKSPYASLKHAMEKVMKNAYKPGNYSEPMVIAETISKAIKTNNPKTRYAAGKMARQTLMGRKWLSDKGFDKMIMRMIHNLEKQG
ncbi:MAG: oxidoreductase [Bacteroidota bacterium]